MPATMQATRTQPKRKRAEVIYYESPSDDSDADVSDVSATESHRPAKVRYSVF